MRLLKFIFFPHGLRAVQEDVECRAGNQDQSLALYQLKAHRIHRAPEPTAAAIARDAGASPHWSHEASGRWQAQLNVQGVAGSADTDDEHAGASPHWSYDAPDEWRDFYPHCAGDAQSPVNFSAASVDVRNGTALEHVLNYRAWELSEGLEVVNNGHSMEAIGNFGSLALPTGNFDAKQIQFHFPAEHVLPDGSLPDGEMQVIHQKEGSSGTDDLAVVAIPLRVGNLSDVEESFYDSLGFHGSLYSLPEPDHSMPLQDSAIVDLRALLDGKFEEGFLHYTGSLTTPPCSETVHWYYLLQSLQAPVSFAQAFKDRFPDPMNSRPVQALHSRKIVKNDIAIDDNEFDGTSTIADTGKGKIVSIPNFDPEVLTHWSYLSATDWHSKYDACGGTRQSPIDVKLGNESENSEFSELAIYRKVGPFANFTLANTGHTLHVNADFGTLSLPNGEYIAKQINFHFPAEHSVEGSLMAGEIQIIHQREGATGVDDIAVVSILLDEGNATLESFLFFGTLGFGATLPQVGEQLMLPNTTTLSLSEVFQAQLASGFVHYTGSLTAPPCSEGVHWFIMKKPFAVGKAMIQNWKEVMTLDNNRPVQKLNGREVVHDSIETMEEGEEYPQPDLVIPEVQTGDGNPGGSESWSYGSPDKWVDAYPNCGGLQQSPVDLHATSASDVNDAPSLAEHLAFTKTGESASDTPLSLTNSGSMLYMNGPFGALALPDGVYVAKQLQFHFPSEHTIDGTPLDGEMHVVFQKENSTETSDLAIVAVLLQAHGASENEFKFWHSVGMGGELPHKGQSVRLPSNVAIDLGETLVNKTKGDYFHYKGSLTSPPCSQSVHWYVLQATLPVTMSIIDKFKTVFPPPMNSRPVQQLNGRRVVIGSLSVPEEFEDHDEFDIPRSEAEAVEYPKKTDRNL
jgi:carbonic anhydrase